MITTDFRHVGIEVPKGAAKRGSVKVVCPQCSHLRMKSDDPCLSITFDKADPASGKLCHAFNCHHCKWRGAIFPDGVPDNTDRMTFVQQKHDYKKPSINLEDYDLSDSVVDFFANRGISEDTLLSAGIKACELSFGKNQPKEEAIIFPFYKGGELINIQYRNLKGKSKRYRSATGAQLIYFGFDQVVMDGYVATDTLYITEGPIDALTIRQCGFPFVWSVPNGSPFEEEGKPPVKSPPLQYHEDPDAQYVLSHVKNVVFVGDNDHQGRRLVQELATRSGIEKCLRITHPPDCKDINEVLTKYGREKVIEVLSSAKRFPVEGVVRISQVIDEVREMFENGIDRGLSTGYDNLDAIMRIGLGRLYIVTGIPESGKSRFVANITDAMANLHGLKGSLFTPESRPFAKYISKMVQIRTKQPFGNPGDKVRMDRDLLEDTLKWLDDYFTFNAPQERTLEAICATWKAQMMSEGVRYGVLDPFNYIIRPPGVDEGTFVLRSLTFLADWCVQNNFTVFVVVHPTKLHIIANGEKKGEYPVVGPYNIYGSSHWYNCADFIISIWRSIKKNLPVQIHTLKAKQEELGTSNKVAYFQYSTKLGIYTPHYGDKDEVLPMDTDDDVQQGELDDEAHLSREYDRVDEVDDSDVQTTKPMRRLARGAKLRG